MSVQDARERLIKLFQETGLPELNFSHLREHLTEHRRWLAKDALRDDVETQDTLIALTELVHEGIIEQRSERDGLGHYYWYKLNPLQRLASL